MQTTIILLIFMLILINTAHNSSTVKCVGDPIKLSCLESSIKDKQTKINALWKKSSGERVIWSYNGKSKTGDSFTNRNVTLHEDLSLSIDGCAQSDQGIYILCIDEVVNCEIRLFVKASKQCNELKTTTEQPLRRPTISEKSIQDATKKQQTKPSQTRDFTKLAVCIAFCLFVLVVISLVVRVYTQREKGKNDKSESKLLNTDTQNNLVKVCV